MNNFLKFVLYPVFVLSIFSLCLVLLVSISTQSDWHDFDVFYRAASSAMAGESIYTTIGQYNLPFWYLPWSAWFFIPYAIFPRQIALFLYQMTSVIGVVVAIHFLTEYYKPGFRLLDKVIIFTLLIPMSLQLVLVGQMDYILLGLLVVIIWGAENKKDILVGILYPFLLTKPHLIVPFTLFLFLRMPKRALWISIVFSAVMLLLETILQPGWYLEMFRLLGESGRRVDGLAFTTFPSLLGGQENWIGTANLPFTLLLILLATLILWKYRTLSTVPFLSLALAASLFCAPRAYAYDLPLLIPAMIWLSAKEFKSKAWIWVIVAFIPVITWFSSAAYLTTLIVCLLGIRKATSEMTLGLPKTY
jgi:hypothetical protein